MHSSVYHLATSTCAATVASGLFGVPTAASTISCIHGTPWCHTAVHGCSLAISIQNCQSHLTIFWTSGRSARSEHRLTGCSIGSRTPSPPERDCAITSSIAWQHPTHNVSAILVAKVRNIQVRIHDVARTLWSAGCQRAAARNSAPARAIAGSVR